MEEFFKKRESGDLGEESNDDLYYGLDEKDVTKAVLDFEQSVTNQDNLYGKDEIKREIEINETQDGPEDIIFDKSNVNHLLLQSDLL